MKPFDLEKALAGEPVVTRKGQKVILIKRTNQDEFPISFVVDFPWGYDADSARLDGSSAVKDEEDDDHDLFMATQKKKLYIAISNKPLDGQKYHDSSYAYIEEEDADSDTTHGFQKIEVEIEI